ncbi:MAG: hypothetical protein OIF32_06570 [Campylobacterales bacterium]|nr:hypothetical protein [Campylobacterales bacterium]
MRLLLLLTLFLFSTLQGQELIKKYQLNLTGFPQNRIGTITNTTGDGDILKIKRDSIDYIRKGDSIHAGDIITQNTGQTDIKFVGGASVKMKKESRFVVNKSGIGQLFGNVEYTSGKKNLTVDTDFGRMRGKNNKLDIIAKNNNILNAYLPTQDSVNVLKGKVNIKAPSGIETFKIKYQDSRREIERDNFTLKKGEKAIFDGERVTIINTNKKQKKDTIDNRKGNRHYFGINTSGTFLQRSVEGTTSSKDKSKLVGRVGLTYAFMDGRIDPIYFLSYTTDPEMDEVKLEYIIPNPTKFQTFWLNSTPYMKYTAGIGKTYSDDFFPTHVSLGLGFGAFKKFGFQYLFTDINYKRREWKFDRTGIDEVWQENELSLEFNYIFRFRI